MKVYRLKDANKRALRNLGVGVIGYGAQGRAQALNMCDSGIIPLIGLPSRSRDRRVANSDGFSVTTVRRMTVKSDIICLLAPDHLHAEIFTKDVQPNLRPGQMLVFAHAASVHFGAVEPPDFVDVVLIAPLGPGKRLRELSCLPQTGSKKPGVVCFFAVFQDASGFAHPRGLALARAIGCLQTGAIETTFAEEALGDIFGEQAVLCGGLARLLKLGFDTLVENGLSPEKAYLECVYQLDLIVDLIRAEGIAGMLNRISRTAAFGAVTNGPRVLDDRLKKNFARIYRDIESGRFFSELGRRIGKEEIDAAKLTDDRFEQAVQRVNQLLGVEQK